MKKLRKWFNDRNINYKKYLIVIYVLCIMAPVMIILSLNDRNSDVFSKTLASVLLLVFFVVFFIYDYRKKLAGDWGMIEVNVSAAPYADIAKEMKGAKNVKLMISDDLPEIEKMLSDIKPEDCRILLFDPESGYADNLRDKDEYASCVGRIEASHSSVKYYSTQPLDNLIIMNETVVIIPRSQKLNDGRRLVRRYTGRKKGYVYYNDIFEHTWDNPDYTRNVRS